MAKIKHPSSSQAMSQAISKPKLPLATQSTAATTSPSRTVSSTASADAVPANRSNLLHWYNFLALFHTFFAMVGMFAAASSYAEYLRQLPNTNRSQTHLELSIWDVMRPLNSIKGPLDPEITIIEACFGFSILASSLGGLFASLMNQRQEARPRAKFWKFIFSFIAFAFMFVSMVVLFEVFVTKDRRFFSRVVYSCTVIGFIATFISMRIHLADWFNNTRILSVFLPWPRTSRAHTGSPTAREEDTTYSTNFPNAGSGLGTSSTAMNAREEEPSFRRRRVMITDLVHRREDTSDDDR